MTEVGLETETSVRKSCEFDGGGVHWWNERVRAKGDVVSHGADVNDGAPLTLRNLCRILADDQEPFPRRYDPDMRKICGHEYLTWLREERSYGDVARLIGRPLAAEDGQMPPVGMRWVHAVLRSGQIGAAS